MAERIPDYVLPAEAERALRDAGMPGKYLGLSSKAIFRCAACHLRRDKAITAASITECVQLERTNVSHGLRSLAERGIFKAENASSITRGQTPKVYLFTRGAAEIAEILPPLSHCDYPEQ